jgi:nitroreductase
VPIENEEIEALIHAAIQAPSAMNQQPWSFCVVRDQEILTRISDAAKSHMLRTAPAGLVSHHFQDLLGSAGFQIFYHAPAMILISATDNGPWGPIDCTLAAQNLMLAAHDAGLGSCWIGFAQTWLGTPEGKALLDLPDTHVPVAPIIVGHPAATAPPVPRREPEIRWIGH